MIKGRGNISVRVLKDSVSPTKIRLTTLECTYPRFIHAEVMTHRMFSRNASSSRAIPLSKNISATLYNGAEPIYWGENKAGMSAAKEIHKDDLPRVKTLWKDAKIKAVSIARAMEYYRLHKQITNRILEPFQMITVIITATEWDNFFHLRLNKNAQPEIQELARLMKKAIGISIPQQLMDYQWHAPYIDCKVYWEPMSMSQVMPDNLKISVARCARVSYRNHDNEKVDDKANISLYRRLYDNEHMSPFEHVATPMFTNLTGWTSTDKMGKKWSGNFKEWAQLRHCI